MDKPTQNTPDVFASSTSRVPTVPPWDEQKFLLTELRKSADLLLDDEVDWDHSLFPLWMIRLAKRGRANKTLVTSIKLIMRKLIRWYVQPAFKNQEAFNHLIVEYLEKMPEQSIQPAPAVEPPSPVPSLDEGRISYSQAGEDQIVSYLLDFLGLWESVTYLDIGANCPIYQNNTYALYKRGGTGVLVEANPEMISSLREVRPADQTLNNILCANPQGKREFYILEDAEFSSTDKAWIENVQAVNLSSPLRRIEMVDTISIEQIFEEYFAGEAPTVLSIDIEGKDHEVLQSVDFSRYRPTIIVVETILFNSKLAFKTKNPQFLQLMQEAGYSEYAFTGINSIFVDEQFLKKRQAV